MSKDNINPNGNGGNLPEKDTPRTFTQEEVNHLMGEERKRMRSVNDEAQKEKAETLQEQVKNMQEQLNNAAYESSFNKSSFSKANEDQKKLIESLTNKDPEKLETLMKTGFQLPKQEDDIPNRETHFHSGGNSGLTNKDLVKKEKETTNYEDIFGISITKK